jgi:cytosine deaminase
MRIHDTWLNGSRVTIDVDGGCFTRLTSNAHRDGPVDLDGGMICPHFAEPHVHLDATQLGARLPNRSGTLFEGIENWATLRRDLTAEDVRGRALKTIRWYVRHGTTRIRTHVDTAGREAVEALLALRDELKSPDLVGMPIKLQVVAFPQEGILTSPQHQTDWESVVAMGCDAVGCIPHYEESGEAGDATVRMCFELAAKHNIQVDLHCDETDDPSWKALLTVCEETERHGFAGRVTAGHCTAMHSWPDSLAERACDWVAQAGVQVVTNPLDNIVLQGRGDRYPKRRGLTRVDELWAAGATVGIGHDSVVDPWYRLGTANMLDPAYMLVHAGHLTGEEQMKRVFTTLHRENHHPFGSVPAIAVGEPATFLWFAASNPIEALRTRQPPRVFYRGQELQS